MIHIYLYVDKMLVCSVMRVHFEHILYLHMYGWMPARHVSYDTYLISMLQLDFAILMNFKESTYLVS